MTHRALRWAIRVRLTVSGRIAVVQVAMLAVPLILVAVLWSAARADSPIEATLSVIWAVVITGAAMMLSRAFAWGMSPNSDEDVPLPMSPRDVAIADAVVALLPSTMFFLTLGAVAVAGAMTDLPWLPLRASVTLAGYAWIALGICAVICGVSYQRRFVDLISVATLPALAVVVSNGLSSGWHRGWFGAGLVAFGALWAVLGPRVPSFDFLQAWMRRRAWIGGPAFAGKRRTWGGTARRFGADVVGRALARSTTVTVLLWVSLSCLVRVDDDLSPGSIVRVATVTSVLLSSLIPTAGGAAAALLPLSGRTRLLSDAGSMALQGAVAAGLSLALAAAAGTPWTAADGRHLGALVLTFLPLAAAARFSTTTGTLPWVTLLVSLGLIVSPTLWEDLDLGSMRPWILGVGSLLLLPQLLPSTWAGPRGRSRRPAATEAEGALLTLPDLPYLARSLQLLQPAAALLLLFWPGSDFAPPRGAVDRSLHAELIAVEDELVAVAPVTHGEAYRARGRRVPGGFRTADAQLFETNMEWAVTHCNRLSHREGRSPAYTMGPRYVMEHRRRRAWVRDVILDAASPGYRLPEASVDDVLGVDEEAELRWPSGEQHITVAVRQEPRAFRVSLPLDR